MSEPMDSSSASRTQYGVRLLLWIPLLCLPLAAFQSRPYTSRGEDGLLLVILVFLAALQVAWKRWGDSKLVLLLPAALWLFLFVLSLRAWPVQWYVPLGALCAVHATVTWLITARLQPRHAQGKPRLASLPVAAFLCAVLFVLIADGILAALQVSERLPWVQRTGFLWPVLFAVPAACRLSSESSVRRTALLVLMVLCAALLVKEHGWTVRLRAAAAEAQQAVRDGEEVLANERLEQALAWNRAKRIAEVEMRLHLIRAALSLRQGEPLEAVADIEQGIGIVPERSVAALRLLDQLSPGSAEQLQAVPEWECSALGVWVDVELRPGEEQSWVLNRWGEIYEGTPGKRERSRLKENTRAARAVDFVCASAAPSGALILYEDGFVESWHGPFEERLEKAIARYNMAPLPRAVDLEWAPGEDGFYVISASGRIAPVASASFDLSETRLWNWKDGMAAALKAAPDGRALYLLDRRGGVHPAGQAAFDTRLRDAPYTEEPGIVADVEFSPDGTGLYFLDVLGGLHTIGNEALPIPRGVLPYFQAAGVVDFEITVDGTLVVLTCNGKLYADRIPSASGSPSPPMLTIAPGRVHY